MSAVPISQPDKPQAEFLRGGDANTGKPVWTIDGIVIDPRDDTTQRVCLAKSKTMRGILRESLVLERLGYHFARAGLAR